MTLTLLFLLYLLKNNLVSILKKLNNYHSNMCLTLIIWGFINAKNYAKITYQRPKFSKDISHKDVVLDSF
jgi:hypothetical protein